MALRLTELQAALARRVLAGCGYVRCYCPPGADRGAWYQLGPYRDEDGRVCEAMVRKGALRAIGDGDYELTEAARAALEARESSL